MGGYLATEKALLLDGSDRLSLMSATVDHKDAIRASGRLIFPIARPALAMSGSTIALDHRKGLVSALMAAHRAVSAATSDAGRLVVARADVDAVKIALGKRGAPWWTDGTPDLNRRMARTMPYAAWFEALPDD